MKKNNEQKKLEILVVEDNLSQIKYAKEDLKDKGNLTIKSTYLEAIEYIYNNSVDVVLTDDRIPYSPEEGYSGNIVHDTVKENMYTDEPQPFGSNIVLASLIKKVPYVAVLTNTDHHDDIFANSRDCLNLLTRFSAGKVGDSIYFENKYYGISLKDRNRKDYVGALNALLTKDYNGNDK